MSRDDERSTGDFLLKLEAALAKASLARASLDDSGSQKVQHLFTVYSRVPNIKDMICDLVMVYQGRTLKKSSDL